MALSRPNFSNPRLWLAPQLFNTYQAATDQMTIPNNYYLDGEGEEWRWVGLLMGRYFGVRSPPRSLLNSKFSFSYVLHFVFNLDKSDCSRSTVLLGCCCCSEVELAFLHSDPKLIISFGNCGLEKLGHILFLGL